MYYNLNEFNFVNKIVECNFNDYLIIFIDVIQFEPSKINSFKDSLNRCGLKNLIFLPSSSPLGVQKSIDIDRIEDVPDDVLDKYIDVFTRERNRRDNKDINI